jgi:hypothetical protein
MFSPYQTAALNFGSSPPVIAGEKVFAYTAVGGSHVENRDYFFHFQVSKALSISALLWNRSSGSGADTYTGLYDESGNRLFASALDTSTTTGVRSVSHSQSLLPSKRYTFVINSSWQIASLTGSTFHTPATSLLFPCPLENTFGGYKNRTAAAMPATMNFLTGFVSSSPPFFGVTIA